MSANFYRTTWLTSQTEVFTTGTEKKRKGGKKEKNPCLPYLFCDSSVALEYATILMRFPHALLAIPCLFLLELESFMIYGTSILSTRVETPTTGPGRKT
jgi:hypothetical protein